MESREELSESKMKLTIKHWRLYYIHAKKFVEALVDRFGHGERHKTQVKKQRKLHLSHSYASVELFYQTYM